MRDLDLSTLNAGDILLAVYNNNFVRTFWKGIHPDMLVVHSVDTASSTAIVAAAGEGNSGTYLLSINEDGITIEGFADATNKFTPVQVFQFTPAEAQAHGLVRRLDAEGKLFKFLESINEDALIHDVRQAVAKEYSTYYFMGKPNTLLGDMEHARKVTQDMYTIAENEYERILRENGETLDKMVELVYEAIAKVNPLLAGSGMTSTHSADSNTIQHHFEYTKEAHTFRVGSTFDVHGVNHTVTRVSKSRAYVVKTDTGEDAGYVTCTKSRGVSLHVGNGEPAVSFRYSPVPVANVDDMQAFDATKREIHDIATECTANLRDLLLDVAANVKFGDNLSRVYRRGIAPHGVTTTTSFLYDLLSEIEAAKEALHEQAEVSMFKLERLIAKTYGK